MTAVTEIDRDLVRWSWRRWTATILVALGVQLGALFYASARNVKTPSGTASIPDATLSVSSPASTTASPEWREEPMLFAAAHPKGFSGAAWMFPPKWPYDSGGLFEPSDYVSFREAALLLPDQIERTPTPSLLDRGFFVAEASRPALLTPDLPRKSALSVQGDIAQRPLLTAPEVPLQVHSDVLANSIVQIGVNEDGLVFSARLLSGSGSKKADQDALEIARRLRFAPEGNSKSEQFNASWGKLIFQWFALDLLSTNGVSR
jgi:TonB family protein